ncbi:unnamed protein product [Pleuronectes platessa]|uniref:Uncharacterized protein n=1 Tax=Pleuronectes platessa TaxID=8262 RepID=A0A9N7YDL5_PLEPL|nr:unnamed protein product [Pleuronectes platessa]
MLGVDVRSFQKEKQRSSTSASWSDGPEASARWKPHESSGSTVKTDEEEEPHTKKRKTPGTREPEQSRQDANEPELYTNVSLVKPSPHGRVHRSEARGVGRVNTIPPRRPISAPEGCGKPADAGAFE